MTTLTFSVRRATPADREAVIALSLAVNPDDFIPHAYDWWMEVLQEPSGFYVAEQDGRLVGCYCQEFHKGDQAYFYAMRIHPEAQGQGIGSRFCQLQIAMARSQGATDIYLLSVLDNHRAHRTVLKNGFVNRGGWLVHAEIAPALAPSPRRARLAGPADQPLIDRFLTARAAGPIAGVIGSAVSPWVVHSMTGADWDLAQAAVVAGEDGLEGLMLLGREEQTLIVRFLEGSPEATADLLALAEARRAEVGATQLAASLPLTAEALLAPLKPNPENAFRAFVFHLPIGSV